MPNKPQIIVAVLPVSKPEKPEDPIPHYEEVPNEKADYTEDRALEGELPEELQKMYDTACSLAHKWKFDAASQELERMLTKIREEDGPDSPYMVKVNNGLAETYLGMGYDDEAFALSEETLKEARRLLRPNSIEECRALNLMSEIYRKKDEPRKESALLEELYPKLPLNTFDQKCDRIKIVKRLSDIYSQLREYRKALFWGEKFSQHIEELYTKEHEYYMEALVLCAGIHDALGEFSSSLAILREIYEYYKKTLGEDHPRTIMAYTELTALHIDVGKFDEAEKMALAILEKERSLHGYYATETYHALSLLNAIYLYRCDDAKREELSPQIREVLMRNNIGGIADLFADDDYEDEEDDTEEDVEYEDDEEDDEIDKAVDGEEEGKEKGKD